MLAYTASIHPSNRPKAARFIITLNPKSIIRNDAISGPLARPILETNPANAAICPYLSKVAAKPRRYGITKPHVIPVTELAIK